MLSGAIDVLEVRSALDVLDQPCDELSRAQDQRVLAGLADQLDGLGQ
jgi:hypothetical protein